MTEAQNDWDLERVQVHNLAAAVLLEQAPTAPAGRAALNLIPGEGAPLKQTLLAFWEGVDLAEHDAPGVANPGPAGPVGW